MSLSSPEGGHPPIPLVRVSTPPLLQKAKILVKADETMDLGSAMATISRDAQMQQQPRMLSFRDSNNAVDSPERRAGAGRREPLFFPTTVKFSQLPDASEHPPVYKVGSNPNLKKKTKDRNKCPVNGVQVEVNGRQVAIFRYGQRVYAVANLCAHNGGPLSFGDIEEVPRSMGSSLVVSCPWHGYQFNLENGECFNDKELRQDVYRTKITKSGTIMVGFDEFDPSHFEGLFEDMSF